MTTFADETATVVEPAEPKKSKRASSNNGKATELPSVSETTAVPVKTTRGRMSKLHDADNPELWENAAEELREAIPNGGNFGVIIKDTSQDRTAHTIAMLVVDPNSADGQVIDVSVNAARVLGWPFDKARGGLRVSPPGNVAPGTFAALMLAMALYPASNPREAITAYQV